MASPNLALDVLPAVYEVAKFPPTSQPPGDLFAAAAADALVSLTRTGDEISVVRPATGAAAPGGVVEGGWKALRVRGPLPFELVGVLARLSAALARAEVSIFAVSTYDTDYVLVKADALPRAVSALQAVGCRVGAAAAASDPFAAEASAPSAPAPKKEKRKKEKREKRRPVVAPPPRGPALTGDAAALHDCFEAYDPTAAAAGSSSDDDALASAFRAAPAADGGLAGLTTEFAGLISADIVAAPAAAPMKLAPPHARYPARAVANRPVAARPPPARPIVVDNRYAPGSAKLAEAFGCCDNAPLGAVPAAAPQQPLQLGPDRAPVSVADAFGFAEDGRGPANGWAL